ncbi:hypothetical protein TWF481_003002 [Arthrobotrys musiformis]|uniref:Uncharacterized protein n=1 Tax=Arthrobotrys musiformis TaxID=47236 RepID=A0AAV9VRV7_9PEZI
MGYQVLLGMPYLRDVNAVLAIAEHHYDKIMREAVSVPSDDYIPHVSQETPPETLTQEHIMPPTQECPLCNFLSGVTEASPLKDLSAPGAWWVARSGGTQSFPTSRRVHRRPLDQECLSREELEIWAKEQRLVIGDALPDLPGDVPMDVACRQNYLRLLWIYRDLGAENFEDIPMTDLIVMHRCIYILRPIDDGHCAHILIPLFTWYNFFVMDSSKILYAFAAACTLGRVKTCPTSDTLYGRFPPALQHQSHGMPASK